MNKITRGSLGVFVIFALVLGAAAGSIVWVLLKIMNAGIYLLWEKVPAYFDHNMVYTFVICLLGGLIIGLWQKKFGILPDTLEDVMYSLKENGTYPYNRLHILAVSALLPLMFGGSLGPEAGLTGIIAGLCCWVSDRLKYKSAEVRELAQAGCAATLGVIFNSPFVGIANNFENMDMKEEKTQQESAEGSLKMKRARMMVYVAAVVGGLGAISGLGKLFGSSMEIARFGGDIEPDIGDWKWFLLLVTVSILCGILYMLCNRIIGALSEKINRFRVISCMLAGLFLAILGTLFPWTMFSGEHEMSEVMQVWQAEGFPTLFLSAIVKLVLINLCINLGWRGGIIFPVIFAGTCMGYAMATLIGMGSVFSVAVCVGALCGYIMRKPLTVIGILLLCFPVRIIIPIAAAAYIGSIIPVFGFTKRRENCI